MSLTAWLLFLPACFAMNLAPGPNNLLSINVAARHGFLKAALGASGRLVAFAAMIALAATGLSVVLRTSATLFFGIKLIGAAYLVWLAIQLWRSDTVRAESVQPGHATLAQLVRRECLVAAGNPKAVLTFTAFLPQFVDPARPMAAQFAIVGSTFLVLECVAIAIYSCAGMHLGKWLARARVRRLFNRCCGTMLGVIGASFLFVQRL